MRFEGGAESRSEKAGKLCFILKGAENLLVSERIIGFENEHKCQKKSLGKFGQRVEKFDGQDRKDLPNVSNFENGEKGILKVCVL